MATFATRPNGRIQAKIRQAGQRPISKTFDTKSDAKRWAREVERDLDRGAINVAATLAEKTRFNDLVERYSREVTPSKKGANDEHRRLAMFSRSGLADLYLVNITPQMVADWRDARLEEVSAPTVNRELNILSHVFTMADKEWGIAANWGNPVSRIRRPKESNESRHGRDRRLTGNEESRLLAAAQEIEEDGWRAADRYGSTPPIPLADIIELAIETAMRRSEILGLRSSAINLANKTLTLTETKGDERRVVPLSRAAIQIIERQPPRLDDRVWPPMHSGSITRAFHKACRRADIRDLRFHDLRHEAVTRLFEKGLDIMEVAAVSGHRDLRMLKRYTHHRAERIAKLLG